MTLEKLKKFLDEGGKLTPTKEAIIKLKPRGSVVSKTEIQELYAQISKTTSRRKRASSLRSRNGKYHSVRVTKLKRGAILFNELTQIGFWKII